MGIMFASTKILKGTAATITPLTRPTSTRQLYNVTPLLSRTTQYTVIRTFSFSTPIRSKMAPQIPSEQWAQVLEATGKPLQYKKIPAQKPGPDEVLINVKYSGVCHTDLHAIKGDWPLATKLPLVGGHEGAGIVVARGELVEDIEIGDPVGIKWINGAGLTVYRGLKESGCKPGDTIAIVGAGGGLGSLALQYAKAMGLHTIAIDGGADKGKHCKELGATSYVDFQSTQDIVADVKAATYDGQGPAAALLVAVQEKPFQQAAAYVRSKGVVVCIGLPADAKISSPVFDTVIRMISFKGSYVGNRADTAEALDFFRRGLINVPYKTVGLSELQSVFELMEANKISGRYVLDTSK